MKSVLTPYLRFAGIASVSLFLGLSYPVLYHPVTEIWLEYKVKENLRLREHAQTLNNPNLLGKLSVAALWQPLRATVKSIGGSSPAVKGNPSVTALYPKPGASDFGIQAIAKAKGNWLRSFSIVVDSTLDESLTLSIARSASIAWARFNVADATISETFGRNWEVIDAYIESFCGSRARLVMSISGKSDDVAYLQIKIKRKHPVDVARYFYAVKLEDNRFASGTPACG
jgi:hypothetical protein